MKTYVIRAALLATVCLAVTACGDTAAPLASDVQGPELNPAAAFTQSAADTTGKYLPTSGNEAPSDEDPGKYLPTSGNGVPAEPGKYLPTSGSEAPDDGDGELTQPGGTGGETGETPTQQL